MSVHEPKEPSVRNPRPPRLSNGVLLFCVLVLAAIVLWQNWPGRARQREEPRFGTTPTGQGATTSAPTTPDTPEPDRVADGNWGDVIEQVDDLPIQSADDLLDALERHRVGDEVALTVERESAKEKIPVRLEASE